MLLVDSHCHLNLLELDQQHKKEDYIERARKNQVGFLLNVAVNIRDFPKVLEDAKTYDHVFASVGLHPNDTQEEVDFDTLIAMGGDEKVVAIGETGLDYYRLENKSDFSWQRNRFATHIAASLALNKALIIHTRAAKEDTIDVLIAENAKEVGGVMHCFTEDWDTAKKALDQNFYISFSGIVTFKNATSIQEVAKKLPLNRLLIETDCPYLAPAPHRGKKNEPAFLIHTAEFLATLRNIPLSELAHQTTENFFTLFNKAKQSHV